MGGGGGILSEILKQWYHLQFSCMKKFGIRKCFILSVFMLEKKKIAAKNRNTDVSTEFSISLEENQFEYSSLKFYQRFFFATSFQNIFYFLLKCHNFALMTFRVSNLNIARRSPFSVSLFGWVYSETRREMRNA